jgi:glutaryl-CoA dehydrogenase
VAHSSTETRPIGPAPFDPTDLVAFGVTLTTEERLIQETVRAFVREQYLGGVAGWFERGEFPVDLVPELGKMGLLGMHLDGYGCAGTNAVSYGLANLELEAGDSGLRSFVSVQGSLAMFPIRVYGSEAQRLKWLPGMAAGELIGCFGLTEPDSGSDPSSMRTRARRDGTDWVLDGTKMWITNGSIADVAVVWAKTDEGIRGFLVPAGTPGFSAHDVPHKLSLRASVTSELVFDSCRLPADAVLPGVSGLRGPLSCLNEARFGIVWGVLGAARACFEAALSYSLTREQFGRPIASFQLTQAKLADMAIELEKGLLLALHLGRLKDEGQLSSTQVSLGKLSNAREALAIARSARTILGANGITLEYPVMRHAANLEAVVTYEGSAEIHQLTIGKAITGLDAFS